MTWYSTGTVTTTANSDIVTGIGTGWTTAGLRPGDMLLIGYNTASPRPFEIKSIDNDTKITLIIAFPVAVAAASYVGIPMLGGDRTAIAMTLAQQITKDYADNQAMQAVWQAFYSGSGTVTLTMPDGTAVTGSSFFKLTEDMAGKANTEDVNKKANKGKNSDITSLTGLTTALSVSQGGTGATEPAPARVNLGLGSAALATIGTGANQIPDMNSFVSTNSSGSGYIKLPGGTIIQWGYSPSGKLGSPIDTAFPIPFTSTNYTVTVSSDNAAAGSAIVVNGSTQRLNNSVFRLMNNTGDTGYTLFWQAIGR